jgi:hypothetical protein
MTSFRTLLVGIEASGPTQWFVNLLEELGSTCQGGGGNQDACRGAPQAKT